MALSVGRPRFPEIEAEGVEVYMPEKKPKGKELSNF